MTYQPEQSVRRIAVNKGDDWIDVRLMTPGRSDGDPAVFLIVDSSVKASDGDLVGYSVEDDEITVVDSNSEHYDWLGVASHIKVGSVQIDHEEIIASSFEEIEKAFLANFFVVTFDPRDL